MNYGLASGIILRVEKLPGLKCFVYSSSTGKKWSLSGDAGDAFLFIVGKMPSGICRPTIDDDSIERFKSLLISEGIIEERNDE